MNLSIKSLFIGSDANLETLSAPDMRYGLDSKLNRTGVDILPPLKSVGFLP